MSVCLFLCARRWWQLTSLKCTDTFDLLWPGEGQRCIKGYQRKDTAGHVHVLHVQGTRHQNYSDFPLLAPDFCRAIGSITDTDPDRAMHVIHSLDVSFAAHVFGPPDGNVGAARREGADGTDGAGGGRGGEGGAVSWEVPESCREMARVLLLEDDGNRDESGDLGPRIGVWTHDAETEESSGSKLGLQK